jgi:hypothetical protein
VVEDESVLGFFSVEVLWCFFLCVVDFAVSEVDDEEAAGVAAGAGAGVDWAKAGPAISARAMTGMSFLNIDVVSRREVVCALRCARSGRIITEFPANKRHMTAT